MVSSEKKKQGFFCCSIVYLFLNYFRVIWMTMGKSLSVGQAVSVIKIQLSVKFRFSKAVQWAKLEALLGWFRPLRFQFNTLISAVDVLGQLTQWTDMQGSRGTECEAWPADGGCVLHQFLDLEYQIPMNVKIHLTDYISNLLTSTGPDLWKCWILFNVSLKKTTTLTLPLTLKECPATGWVLRGLASFVLVRTPAFDDWCAFL